MRYRDVTIKSFLNSSAVACPFSEICQLFFPKKHSENGKKWREERHSELHSVLTFINSRKIKFLEQTGTLLLLGIIFFFSPYSPKPSIRDLTENYFPYGIPAGR